MFDAATKKLGVTPTMDPEAHAVNAFHILWKKAYVLCFLPI